MGTPPIQPSKESPISKDDSHIGKGGVPNNAIIIGVLISVAIGMIILVANHFKKNKKVDTQQKPDDPIINDSESDKASVEQTQETITEQNPQHEEISKKFSDT